MRHADQTMTRIDGLIDVTPAHARADHRDVMARASYACCEGRDGRVDAACDYRRVVF